MFRQTLPGRARLMVRLTFGIWVGPIVLTLLGCRDAGAGRIIILTARKFVGWQLACTNRVDY